jgi:hypothetical protein
MIVTTWKTAKTELKEKGQKGMGCIHLNLSIRTVQLCSAMDTNKAMQLSLTINYTIFHQISIMC